MFISEILIFVILSLVAFTAVTYVINMFVKED